ncbi:MAG: baseplate protein [Hyphomicrobiales bacterium]|nr:MAG: baseplate protein [Hyphomicrobiales bacterium]
MDEQKDWLGRGWQNPVKVDPRTKAIMLVEYGLDIGQAIEIILSTSRGERVMRPDFGCGIHDLVYDVMDVAMLTRVETEVRESLIKYEARIEVIRVATDPRHAVDGKLLVAVAYRVRRTNQTGNYVYPFYFREGGASQAEVRRQ